MENIFHVVDRISEIVGKLASFLVVVLIIAIGYDITTRYLFSKANFWAYDMTIFLYGSYAMLGAAYCHYTKGHVRMDLLTARMSLRARSTVDVVCYILLFFPLFIILIYKCGGHAIWALLHSERSSASAWRPYMAPFKMAILLGLVLFFLQGVVDFLRSLRIALKGGPHES